MQEKITFLRVFAGKKYKKRLHVSAGQERTNHRVSFHSNHPAPDYVGESTMAGPQFGPAIGCALFSLEIRFSLLEESADAFLRIFGVEKLSKFFAFDLQVYFG